MAILGLLIQTKIGLPIYFEIWSEKIRVLKSTDTELVSGFFSALLMFSDSMNKKIGYIRLLDGPMEIYGVDTVFIEIGSFLMMCFVDSYQFHELTKMKLNWIYTLILKKYESDMKSGAALKLNDTELILIEDILRDHFHKSIIFKNKNQLNLLIDELISDELNKIYGISINSFDNSILYSFGIEYDSLELFLNNVGQKASLIKEHEILFTYVSIPDFIPVLVVIVNPALNFPIDHSISEILVGDKKLSELPVYLSIIMDVSSDVNTCVETILEKILPLFN